jgi:hypothetical protein
MLETVSALVHGQRLKAKELFRVALEIAGRKGLAGVQLPNPAVIDALVGDCEPAREAKLTMVHCMDASAVRLAEKAAAKNPPPDPDNVGRLYLKGDPPSPE